MNELAQVTAFGVGLVAIVYWLVEHARRVKLITDKRVAFLAGGAIWLLIAGLYAQADGFSKPAYVYVVTWLGGWVATLLFKAGVKDNETQPKEGNVGG